MEAARLLYGELELNVSSALFAVDQLDEGFDILASLFFALTVPTGTPSWLFPLVSRILTSLKSGSSIPDWISKKEQETKEKNVVLKDGKKIKLKYLFDNTDQNRVAYILGFDENNNQISTVMIEKGKDGKWRGNDLWVDKNWSRKGKHTTTYWR